MKQLFESQYTQGSREDLKDFLNGLFGNKISYNTVHQAIENQTLYFDNQQCYELAHIELDKEIVVYEIKQRSINDPRVTLTKDAFKLMQNKGVNNALIVFYSDDSSSWRLSLLTIKRGFGGTETSDHKRYSYLLGEGEKLKTPLQYLEKSVSDFKDLVDRFDVEVVRKEFFNHYLELYIRLYKAIKEDADFVAILNKQNVELVSFTKNLLGKIIFLYFIQKKGWLGVRPNGMYGVDGDKNFMRNLWNDFQGGEHSVLEKKDFFYNDYLEWLFHAGLNKDNTDTDDFNEYFDKKVPFLNGGLFKEEYTGWRSHVCKVSNDIFSNDDKDGILDIFDLYNFTIDEDDLTDSEMAVDPEMLGRIFEKMIAIDKDNISKIIDTYNSKRLKSKIYPLTMDIENWKVGNNNKKLGAFYTPREIVHYMTKESLVVYLVNNLKGKREEKEKQVRDLFDVKDSFLVSQDDLQSAHLSEDTFDRLGDIIQDIDTLLRKVKILDPAVGSGAFPMGVLHEISSIRYYIYGVFYKNFGVDVEAYKDSTGKISMYEIKKDIILNNIYGVDISPGAIDIARLRFWLSLVVDEVHPEPLPNFEFKFVCANTLIPLQNGDGLFDNQGLEEELRKNAIRYFNSKRNKDKIDLQSKISKLLHTGQDSLDFVSEKEKQLKSFNPFDPKSSAMFFDFNLMMGIRRGEKFDIVIGNPPYIKEYDNKDAFSGIKGKEYYMGKMDIWYYFSCYTLDFLKDKGIQSFIAQNNWTTSHGAKLLRNKILDDSKILEFIDFGDYKVFENVGIQTMIFLLEKSTSNLSYDTSYSKLSNKKYDKAKISAFLKDKNSSIDYVKYNFKINYSELYGNNINFISPLDINVINKISSQGDFCLNDNEVANGIHPHHGLVSKAMLDDLHQGAQVGDGIFYLSDYELKKLNLSNKEKEIIKPLYFSTEVFRYSGIEANQYHIIYTESKFKDTSLMKNYPAIKNHLDRFSSVITSDNKPYGLHRSRKEDFFIGNKIVSLRKVAKPEFSYIDFTSYYGAEFYIIKSDRVNAKYLTGLLNSKLIQYWLKHKGKMQGDNYQIDKDPLVNIPIVVAGNSIQENIIEKVEGIIILTKSTGYDPEKLPKKQQDLEYDIDILVYQLYSLTEDEIKIIEDSIK